MCFGIQGAEKAFGYNSSEIIGKPLDFLVPESYLAAHKKGFQRFVDTGIPTVIGKAVELIAGEKGRSRISNRDVFKHLESKW